MEAMHCSNASVPYEIFINIFTTSFDDHFQLKFTKQRTSKTSRHDWITTGLMKYCIKKSILYKIYKRRPTPENKSKYICYRNRLKTSLNRAERDFYRNKFKLLAGNLSQAWKLLRNVINKNRPSTIVDSFVKDRITISNPKDVVEHFNDFFVTLVKVWPRLFLHLQLIFHLT